MSPNLAKIIALGDKVGIQGCLFDQGGDVSCHNVAAWLYKAEWGRWGAVLDANASTSLGKGLDRTEPAWAQGVVNGGTLLAILLVLHVQGDGLGKEELCKGGSVREHDAMESKSDVLEAELDRPGAYVGLGHGVLAHME